MEFGVRGLSTPHATQNRLRHTPHQIVSTPVALPLSRQLGQGPCRGWLFLAIPAIT